MDEQITEAPASAPTVSAADPASAESTAPAAERGRRGWRWVLPVVLTPVVLFVLAVIAWAVDTSSSGVPRNVELAGIDISSMSEAELAARLDELAEDITDTPVVIELGSRTYETDAAGIGLMLDQDRTSARALHAGRDGFVLARPLGWMRSFLSPREVDPVFQVNRELVDSAVIELEGDARTAPVEPSIELVDGAFHVITGKDGRGIDTARLAEALPKAAVEAGPGQPILVTAERAAIPPLASDEAAREAASQADQLATDSIEIETDGGSRTIEADELRAWMILLSQKDGTAAVGLDPLRVAVGLRSKFADVDGHPVDARITVEGGAPVIVADQPGLICCGDGANEAILAALVAGDDSVELELVEGEASFTAADAAAYKITGPVGGNNAWRDGAPTTAEPGFTTYHAPTGARIINIHRIADIIRGAIIPPGESFSINEFVGKRTVENGFVTAGAIASGMHVDEIGGGISQFATTMFNAAYFAGLDIDEYQAHSEWFDRYPRGREATMGYPKPDLRITNNTPYGILIWTSYTQTSLTVTLYSSPYATAEQTAISESTSGQCRVVVTTRTRTFPDGHTEDDKFRARYRPGEGQSC